MAASTRQNHHHHNRSLSPSGRFCSYSISASSSFASSTPTLSSRSSTTASVFDRSSSPTRVNLNSSSPNRQTPSSSSSCSSVRFSIDNRATSPGRAAAIFVNRSSFSAAAAATAGKKKTCMCSPTTHRGSFRCNFHKNLEAKRLQSQNQPQSALYQPHRLNMRRSAMTNSLVRIGTVEGGEWVKRAVATLIRPSSHQQRRRGDFRPQPSRLSVMSMADD